MEAEVEHAPAAPERAAFDGPAREDLEAGLAALEQGRLPEAIERLERAHERAPDHARTRSFLGLAIARAEGDFSRARALCEEATKQEFFNPELYLNLAKVYLRFDRRAEALRYLRRGQMIDPGNRAIREAIASLGRRRLPILPFLPRRHPMNRALGSARKRLLAPFRRA